MIAADRGMEFCARESLVPDMIVGDYDSVEQAVLEYFRGCSGIQWVDLQPEKDDTDTETAVHLALEQGSTQIHLLGASGSRVDHMLGNIQLLYQIHKAGVEGFLVDACNRIRLISGNCSMEKAGQFGRYVSLLPFQGTLSDVTLQGMKYPLDHGRILVGTTLGISNEIVEDQAVISVGEDLALLIEASDR